MGTSAMMYGSATRWRVVATTRPLAMALVAGILATHIATVMGYWFHGIGLRDLDFPTFNGYLLFRPEMGAADFAVFGVPLPLRLLFGWTAHLFTGVVWAMIYAVLVQPMLKWKSNMAKALAWGAVLAIISGLWWVPVLFDEFDLGFAAWNFDTWKGIVAIFLWHAIWAVNLALFYNPLSDDEIAALNAA
ncbi:MAG: hypothetical protein WD895_06345 [Acidimicrobiia bacterium]